MSAITREEYATILSDFLKGVGFEMPSWGYDPSLEEPVMRYFKEQPWEPHHREKAVRMEKWMSSSVGMCYPFADRDTQVANGIFATYVLLIDDLGGQVPDALEEFQHRLTTGQPQKSPMQSLVRFLPVVGGFFGPYAEAMIAKSTTEFVYGCLLEHQYDRTMEPPPAAAQNFPRYLRQRTGYAEPVAHFVFPKQLYPEETCLGDSLPIIPDLCDFINYINDILSFYKETVVGDERLNFICNLSRVRGTDFQETLRFTCSELIESVRRIRTVLSSKEPMLRTTNQFLCGYIAWYLNQDRYRLSDVDIMDKNGVKIIRTARGDMSVSPSLIPAI